MHLSSQGLIGVNWAIHTLDDNDYFNYKKYSFKNRSKLKTKVEFTQHTYNDKDTRNNYRMDPFWNHFQLMNDKTYCQI